MHAYLIVGDSEKRKAKSEELAKKLKANILEFPLAKIEDTRQLKSFSSLKITSPTAIFIDSIEKATEEASNAFLKNLEEPQENLYYLLTTSSLAAVLPTIVSRCEIIKVQSTRSKVLSTEPQKFMKKTIGEKLTFIDKIKDREEAKEFVENLVNTLHFNLTNTPENYPQLAKNLEITTLTLNNLKANGNVALQLSNMVINLV